MAVMTENQIKDELKNLDGWKYNDPVIHKSFKFKDFREAFSKMTAIAFVAEDQQHHPDWKNSYNTLEISLTSHDAGGITEKDFKMAKAIEEAI